MKLSKYLRVSVAALAVAGALVVACSDDSTGGTAADAGGDVATKEAGGSDTSTPIDAGLDTSKPDVNVPGVTVHVTYTGTKTGNLTVAFFTGTTPPPVPPPAALTQVVGPVFPATKKVSTLAPGSYLVTAYIDVGGNNVSGPGPEDPKQVGFPTVTFAGADVSVDIVLTDPDGG